MRERWFGSTGRRVPEIAVEGDEAVPLDDALVLDAMPDETAVRDAHAAGTPVVVRTSDEEGVKRALAHAGVSCVLVPPDRRDLLELDLRKLTYG
ncbi:MAG: hypothetical protein KY396_01045 [Actinobacteria bacterium]|nr:hypothetical protein [Actinomycetota bacterium]